MIKEITIQPNASLGGDSSYLRIAVSYTDSRELLELAKTVEGKKKMCQDQLDLLQKACESAKKMVEEYSTMTEEEYQKGLVLPEGFDFPIVGNTRVEIDFENYQSILKVGQKAILIKMSSEDMYLDDKVNESHSWMKEAALNIIKDKIVMIYMGENKWDVGKYTYPDTKETVEHRDCVFTFPYYIELIND